MSGQPWRYLLRTWKRRFLSRLAGRKRRTNSRELGHAPGMAAALERRVQEDAQAVLRHLDIDQPGAQGENIGIVVGARQEGADAVVEQSGAQMAMAVGGEVGGAWGRGRGGGDVLVRVGAV